MIVARITNEVGRSFNVCLIRKGDRYGRGDALTHDADDPLVEFYDATYEHDARFDLGRGQFVTRYCLSTLLDRDGDLLDRGGVRTPRRGLDLCGYEPAWKISGTNVAEVLAAVGGALAALARSAS